jgi:flagellar hook-length control protein FliK
MHLERSLPDSSFASELTKLANSSGDVPPPNLSAIQAEAGLLGAAIERGLAPTAIASASSPDHFLPTLEPRLGSAGWDSALGQKVVWMASQQQQIAELSLNPPDLGPLQIVLSINNDQASAMFVSHNADVRQALEAALPRLKEMMADSGISLGNTTISSDSSQQGALMEGFERQNHSDGHHSGAARQTNAIGSERAGVVGISIRGLVDTFA